MGALTGLLHHMDWLSMLLFVMSGVACLICLTVHELSHGLAAYKLGDPTAKSMHRLSLNPLRHIDWLGLASMLLLGFGWAKPVPVDPRYFKKPKQGMALTALAGPVSNILAGFVGTVVYYFLLCLPFIPVQVLSVLSVFFYYYISINLMLAVFNLLPAPPLDGSRLVAAFLPNRMVYQYYRYERYVVLVLFVLLFTGVLDPVLSFLHGHLWNAVISLGSAPFRALGLL